MKNILAQANQHVLEQFTWSNVLLAFDYDGTLAPIVSRPDQAEMRPETRHLLQELTRLYPVIVISGRAQADARHRLRGLGVRAVIGNHGIEPWHEADAFVGEVQRWGPRLRERLAPFRGVTIEDKIFSIAVHYRQSREKRKARAAIVKAAAALGAVRLLGGKAVINVLPVGAPHKGMALERERDRLGCDTAIYVGDDETDEDVFSLDEPGRLLTIRVGARRGSAARWCLPHQAAVDALLSSLLRTRSQERRQSAR